MGKNFALHFISFPLMVNFLFEDKGGKNKCIRTVNLLNLTFYLGRVALLKLM